MRPGQDAHGYWIAVAFNKTYCRIEGSIHVLEREYPTRGTIRRLRVTVQDSPLRAKAWSRRWGWAARCDGPSTDFEEQLRLETRCFSRFRVYTTLKTVPGLSASAEVPFKALRIESPLV